MSAMGAMTGHVYLVGAGPGDPDLLTVRAAKVLRAADSIVYDRLVHPGALEHASPHTRLLYVGKEGGGPQVSQDEINELLIAQARLGRAVVRLKGGDPFVFGRGGEEALALSAARIPFSIVPGVTSGVAGPALAGIPVTHRGVAASVTFATATLAEGDASWAHLAGAPTLVLFMANLRLGQVCARLAAAGRAPTTPAAIVEAASLPGQRVLTAPLGELAALAEAARVGSPALLVVGEVVAVRDQLATFVPSFAPSLVAAQPAHDASAFALPFAPPAAQPAAQSLPARGAP
jgi:uroporphyrin-III C-methyltransferase